MPANDIFNTAAPTSGSVGTTGAPAPVSGGGKGSAQSSTNLPATSGAPAPGTPNSTGWGSTAGGLSAFAPLTQGDYRPWLNKVGSAFKQEFGGKGQQMGGMIKDAYMNHPLYKAGILSQNPMESKSLLSPQAQAYLPNRSGGGMMGGRAGKGGQQQNIGSTNLNVPVARQGGK